MTVKTEAGDLELLTNGVIRRKGNTNIVMRLVYASDRDAELVLAALAKSYVEQKPAPDCAHSECAQHYIDTGDNDCITEEPKELEPPDLKQCQADKPGNGPFTVGGEIGDPNNGYRVRCKNKPSFIATEKTPGSDGKRGSMSLCTNCESVLVKQMGADFATFEEINAAHDSSPEQRQETFDKHIKDYEF